MIIYTTIYVLVLRNASIIKKRKMAQHSTKLYTEKGLMLQVNSKPRISDKWVLIILSCKPHTNVITKANTPYSP